MQLKTKSPRWYLWRDGQIVPCYETPKKGNNGMKAYSLREAREDKALVSVTSVLQVIDKPMLNDSRVSKAIHSALTLPRYPDEGEDSFAERVLKDSEEQSAKACEFGTRIHDAIAWSLTPSGQRDEEWSTDQTIVPFLYSFSQWANENIEEVHAVEKVVGHPSLGVAGRLDLDCTLKGVGRTILDFKSQAIKDGKPTFWSDWCPQLSAYAECLSLNEKCELARIMSIVIPSNEPGPIHTRLYPVEEQGNGMNAFHHALALWIHFRGNGYDPRQ